MYFSPMLNFDNTENAFEYKSNAELRKANLLFSAMGNPWLSKIGIKLTTWAFKVGIPIKSLVKNTLFKQFCGGETLTEASQTASAIFNYGVGVILDYGVEGKTTEKEFDETAQGFIQAIQFAAGKKHIPFISIKVTGFGRFELLQKMDEGESLNSDELAEWEKVKTRMNTIAKTAVDNKVMILIDAEETWIQDPIDQLALEIMQTYNTSKAFIFNTYQMYRHDRLKFVEQNIAFAKQKNFILGAKLVRGAYMEKERARALENNYTSPIQPNKQSSDNDFDEAVSICLNNSNNCHVFIGTHNEQSCYKATKIMTAKNIKASDDIVYFSQLFGMSDNISFNLAKAGYNVSKYLPYGPVHDVVPYLMRRAQENTSVEGQTGRELTLIKKELQRRKSKA
jgi:proline dehydrogenase